MAPECCTEPEGRFPGKAAKGPPFIAEGTENGTCRGLYCEMQMKRSGNAQDRLL